MIRKQRIHLEFQTLKKSHRDLDTNEDQSHGTIFFLILNEVSYNEATSQRKVPIHSGFLRNKIVYLGYQKDTTELAPTPHR